MSRSRFVYGVLAASLLLGSCKSGLLVKRYESSVVTAAEKSPATVLKLLPLRQYKLLEVVGSQQVLTGGRWHKENGQIVLDKKRQRGFDPMPTRWIGVKENAWRSFAQQGDSLLLGSGNSSLIRKR